MPMANSFQASPALPARKARTTENRLPLRLPGRFLGHDDQEHPLATISASCHSAEIRANTIPPIGTQIVCYVDELGRISGTIEDTLPNGFLLRFSNSSYKRDKLADQLTWLINKDTLGLSEARQSQRFEADAPALLTLEEGGALECRVLDISLTGAGFESIDRRAPTIGTIVHVGNIRAEIVRSVGRSFGVRYLR